MQPSEFQQKIGIIYETHIHILIGNCKSKVQIKSLFQMKLPNMYSFSNSPFYKRPSHKCPFN